VACRGFARREAGRHRRSVSTSRAGYGSVRGIDDVEGAKRQSTSYYKDDPATVSVPGLIPYTEG